MSDINDRLNGDSIEISRRDVREHVTDIIYTNSEVADGEVLQYNSTTGLFSSVSPNAAGLYVEGGTDLPVTDGGTGASTASGARTNLGIGSLATQDVNNVHITGGSITGITDLAVADGGTGVSTLTGIVKGNGTSAFSAAVQGTDYYAPGGTDVAVADGGTGASTHTSGNILIGNGASAWTSVSNLNVATGGLGISSDTAYAVLCGGTTSAGAVQSIADLGSASQWLTSNGAGALPTFQAAGTVAKGGMTYISTQTASGSSSITFTGLSNSYKRYRVVYFDLIGSSAVSLNLRVGTTESYTIDTGSNYVYCNRSINQNSSQTNSGSASSSGIVLTQNNILDTANIALCGSVDIVNPSQTSVYHLIHSRCSGAASAASGIGTDYVAGVYKSTTAITAVQLFPSSGTFTGTFILYGAI